MKTATVVNLPTAIRWIGRDGMPIACDEKLRMLNENLEEVRQICQQALDDAVIMGCSEHFVRVVLSDTIASLDRPYGGRVTSVSNG